MPWTRLDDGFIAHPKILRLSHIAFRLHVSGLNWSVANTTDGKIPEVVLAIALPLDRARIRDKAAVELEQAGLWNRNGSGWEIHDFAVYQETKEVISERRRKWAEQKRVGKGHSLPDSAQESITDSAQESTPESYEASSRTRGRPTPSHKELSKNSLSEGLTTPREALRAWATIQGTNSTDAWLKPRLKPAQNFLEQHPDLGLARLIEFLEWAYSQGVAEPAGWPSWWPTWPSSPASRTLPDCPICENRRLVPIDDDWSAMKPCTCTGDA